MKIIYRICLLAACLMGGTMMAQPLSLNWKNAGPDNLGSKTRALAFDANGHLLAGSAGGGLWKSEDEGLSWKRVDSYANQNCNPNITAISVKGNEIYVATGEVSFLTSYLMTKDVYDYESLASGYFGYIGNPGGGVYVSKDNGATWETVNATNDPSSPFGAGTSSYSGSFSGVQSVFIHSSGRIYLGTRKGLFYSDDKLATVDTALVLLDTTVLIKTFDPASRPRFPRFRNAIVYDIIEGASGEVYVSANAYSEYGPANTRKDGGWIYRSVGGTNINAGRPTFLATDSINYGVNFGKIGVPDGTGIVRRVKIASAPSDKNVIYLSTINSLGEVEGVWKTTTGFTNGNTLWERVAPQGGPGFTPLALGGFAMHSFVLDVDPADPKKVILGGNNWYTYSDATGWISAAQNSNPSNTRFVPKTAYCILHDKNDPKKFYIGTDAQIVKTEDGGLTFRQRTKGYEASLNTSVAGIKNLTNAPDPDNVGAFITDSIDAILSGTARRGVQYNKFYTKNVPTAQGFGDVYATNYSDVQISYIYPSAVVAQHTDLGLVRSGSAGATFETFYGFCRNPMKASTGKPVVVKNITISTQSPDTIVDRNKATDEGGGLRDRKRNAAISSADYFGPNITQFVLDETIPDSLLEAGKNKIQAIDNYIFFCSGQYVWMIEYPFGSQSGLTPKWTRITNSLAPSDEVFTAMAVSGDSSHNIIVGTSKGALYLIKRPHDIKNLGVFSAKLGDNVVRISDVATGDFVKDRQISSIAVDPTNPKRVVITYSGFGLWSTMNPKNIVLVTDDITASAPSFRGIWAGEQVPNVVANCAKFIWDYKGNEDPSDDEISLFIGTETGLFVGNDLSVGNFKKTLAAEIGNVPVTDIFVRKYYSVTTDLKTKDFKLYKDNTIFLSTYGKGVYVTTDLQYPQREGTTTTPVTMTDAQVFPNPSNGTFSVKVNLVKEAEVSVSLTNMEGKEVYGIVPTSLSNGSHVLNFVANGLTPGMYFVNVTAKGQNTDFNQTYKLVITK